MPDISNYTGTKSEKTYIHRAKTTGMGNDLDFKWEKYVGYSPGNHNCRLKTSCYKAILKAILSNDVQSCGFRFKQRNVTNIFELSSMLHGKS